MRAYQTEKDVANSTPSFPTSKNDRSIAPQGYQFLSGQSTLVKKHKAYFLIVVEYFSSVVMLSLIIASYSLRNFPGNKIELPYHKSL